MAELEPTTVRIKPQMASTSDHEPISISTLIERRYQRKVEIRKRINNSFGRFSGVTKLWPFVLLAILWHLLWCTAVLYNTVNDSITSYEYKKGTLERIPIHGVYTMLVTFTVAGALIGGVNFALHIARAICVLIRYFKPQWQNSSFDIASAAPTNNFDDRGSKGWKRYKEWGLLLTKYYLSLCTPGNLIKMCSHDKAFSAACLSVDVFTLVIEATPQSLIAYLGFDIIYNAPVGFSGAKIEITFEIFCLIQCFMAIISFLVCLCKHGCKGWVSGLGFFGFFAGFLVLRCVIPALNCQATGYCPT